jgi:hypothetical protein
MDDETKGERIEGLYEKIKNLEMTIQENDHFVKSKFESMNQEMINNKIEIQYVKHQLQQLRGFIVKFT